MSDEGENIGHGHVIHWFGWHPDRELNPQYEDIPDVDRMGVRIEHQRADRPDEACIGSAIVFDTEANRKALAKETFDRPLWQLEQEDPLTVSPSILCRECGDHGYIRDGAWEPA